MTKTLELLAQLKKMGEFFFDGAAWLKFHQG